MIQIKRLSLIYQNAKSNIHVLAETILHRKFRQETGRKKLEIRNVHKDHGYRRIVGELRNQNIIANKK